MLSLILEFKDVIATYTRLDVRNGCNRCRKKQSICTRFHPYSVYDTHVKNNFESVHVDVALAWYVISLSLLFVSRCQHPPSQSNLCSARLGWNVDRKIEDVLYSTYNSIPHEKSPFLRMTMKNKMICDPA